MTTQTTQAPTSATPVSLVKAPWMRAAVMNQAIAAGWKFTQVSTSTDQYTKGTQVLVISWSSVVTKASHQPSSKVSPKTLEAGHASKLQIITNWLGFKEMAVTAKWTPSHLVDAKGQKISKEKLAEQASNTFKVMTEAK